MPNRHSSERSQELCSSLSYSTQVVASWDIRTLPLVSGHAVRHVLERHSSEAEEEITPRSVSSCMTVLTTEQIPITILEGLPAAEVGVLLHGQP